MKNKDCPYSQGDRWFLIYEFLRKNSRKGRPVSRKQILDYLYNTYDIKISVNTFYSDIAAVQRDPFSLDVQLDKRAFRGAGGYWVANTLFKPHELRLMVDSIQSSQFITQKTADAISQKIKTMAGDAEREALKRPAVVANRIKNMNESVVEGSGKFYEAIDARRKASFLYFHKTPSREQPKAYTNGKRPVIVSPFALFWNKGLYYLYAYDGTIFRTYRVDRMEDIRVLNLPREGENEYNASNLTQQRATVFEMYGGKEYAISFRCQNQMTDAVLDAFGEGVSLIPDGDNHFTFSALIEESPPFYAWVAKFGRRIKITAPDEIIVKMKAFLQKSAEMYE